MITTFIYQEDIETGHITIPIQKSLLSKFNTYISNLYVATCTELNNILIEKFRVQSSS